MTDRSEYWKEYNAKNRDRLREKSKRQAAKQKKARAKDIASRPRCAVCGKPFKGRAIASATTLSSGVHRACDPARWMAEHRKK